MGSKESPISYKMFSDMFHPVLQANSHMLHQKWAPCLVLPPASHDPDTRFTICNVTTVDSDTWRITDESLAENYELVNEAVVPAECEPEALCKLLEPFMAGHEDVTQDINWYNLKTTLNMENKENQESLWRVARPKNMVVAVPVTPCQTNLH